MGEDEWSEVFEVVTRSARHSKKMLARFRHSIEEAPDRLSPTDLNSAFLLLLENQVSLLTGVEALGSLLIEQRSNKQACQKEVTKTEDEPDIWARASIEDDSDDLDDDLEIIEDNLNISINPKLCDPNLGPVSDFYARIAIKVFDKRDQEFDRGFELMKSWVGGVTGTPFQIRKDPDYAYLNVTDLSLEKAMERATRLGEIFGFSKRLGRIVYEGLNGEVWLYSKE